MKTNLFKDKGLWLYMLGLMMVIFGVGDAASLMAGVVTPDNGGAVNVEDSTTTVTDTHENSENLILDTIDEKVTKIRPHDVVLDTISRHVNDTKNSNNQVIRHYAIDVIGLNTTVTTPPASGKAQDVMVTADNDLFACDQTIICNGIKGYMEDGTTIDPNNELMLYVVDKDASNNPIVMPVNGQTVGSVKNAIPTTLVASTVLTRAGRAGSETQIRTDAYSGVPTDFEQYLQKFMAQIEESTLMKIADKEVDWEFSDQEEEAVFDMKRVQNITFWKGVKRRLKVKNKHSQKPTDIYFTGGIWNQAGKDFSFGGTPVDSTNIVSMMKTAFTGNSSSKQKLIICGSDVIEAFEKVDYNKVVYPGTRLQAYGLEFGTVVSKFGTLLSVHDQTLDDLGMADKAFILDADFLRKWTMGWRVNDFDFKKSGESDVDARSLIEICGLVLKNPEAHCRVSLT